MYDIYKMFTIMQRFHILFAGANIAENHSPRGFSKYKPLKVIPPLLMRSV